MDSMREKITPEQLHIWYLEAITYLDGRDFNIHADVPYEDLTEGQKSIDGYIADKINALIQQEPKVMEKVMVGCIHCGKSTPTLMPKLPEINKDWPKKKDTDKYANTPREKVHCDARNETIDECWEVHQRVVAELKEDLSCAEATIKYYEGERKTVLDCLTNVAQIFDGWHCDKAWSSWDETIRKQVSILLEVLKEDK